MNIPEKFYHGDAPRPMAYTIGELKELLSELPDELGIESDWSAGVAVIVYNHGTPYEHLEFEEIEQEEE